MAYCDLERIKAESSRKNEPNLRPTARAVGREKRGQCGSGEWRVAREQWPVVSRTRTAVSECDEMELAVILMPVLPMGPSRPWRSLGGMLAFSRAWSAAEVMPAKDTPRIVQRQGLHAHPSREHGTRTHRRGVEKWSRRNVSLTLLAPVEKHQNEANCS